MPYSYIPGSKDGDPERAAKLLLKVFLVSSGIGLLWILAKKILGK